MKSMKNMMAAMVLSCACALSLMAGEIISSYNTTTDGTSAVVNFSKSDNGWNVKATYAKVTTADATTAALKWWGSSGDVLVSTAVATSGATVITLDNSAGLLTTNSVVLYCYSDGSAPLYSTISAATTTNITLGTGLGKAGTVKDRIYELTQIGEVSVATTAFNQEGDVMLATRSDSPLRVTCGTGTNISLTVTAGKR